MQSLNNYTFLKNYFSTIFANDSKTIPHCILFHGEDVEAQYAIALELARLLNCKENRDETCECLNCRWIRENTHPAVMTISKVDNKPTDDTSEKVISIKQAGLIKNILVTASDAHRVFIFCDKDDEGNVCGLNNSNFQTETANSMLKIIEEPDEGVTFIFLTKNKDDVLPTIVSRSQCFYVPSFKQNNYDYSLIANIFENYWTFDRSTVFDISQKLTDIAKTNSTSQTLDQIQNYIFCILKQNPQNIRFINDLHTVEFCKKQALAEIKAQNIFDDLCLKLIK